MAAYVKEEQQQQFHFPISKENFIERNFSRGF